MEQLNLKLAGTDNFLVKEAYKFLRTNIQFCGQDIKTIAITSCGENEGKSTVSMHIAKSFAELDKKVLLIDADMRKSVIAGRNFGAKDVKGLSEFLSGIEKDVTNCLYTTDVPNMVVMFAGNYPPNPSELLAGKYFDMLLAATREQFDYIIIDTPPLGAVTDAALIAAKSDGTILVVGAEKINRKEAVDVVDQLKSSGTKVLGAIRNNVTQEKSKYYYRRRGYYKRGYYKKHTYYGKSEK